MTQHFRYPTREEAILMDSVNGVTIHSYTVAIGSIVQPKNVRFVSRISLNRVCIYFTDKSFVQNLAGNTVIVEGHKITVRPLVFQATRMLISNVPPYMNSEKLISVLKSLQVDPASNVTFVRSGTKTPGYEHVFCFRRQVYVKPSDTGKIPPRLEVEDDGVTSTIYFASENLSCFLCGEEGHIAKFCGNLEKRKTRNLQEVVEKVPKENASIPTTPASPKPAIAQENTSTPVPDPQKRSSATISKSTPKNTFKRPASSPANSHQASPRNDFDTKEGPSFTRHKSECHKRAKRRDSSTSLSEILNALEPAKENIVKNHNRYPLSFDKLTEFLQKTYSVSDIRSVALQFTEDTDRLVDMLSDTRREISCPNLKARLLRSIDKLSRMNVADAFSDSSFASLPDN
uniref:CCHC-type domain-containing protein n=1 Tax=Trichogramma kaykai TaxID=54128 RepID=A0ABD2W5S1_9HYME